MESEQNWTQAAPIALRMYGPGSIATAFGLSGNYINGDLGAVTKMVNLFIIMYGTASCWYFYRARSG